MEALLTGILDRIREWGWKGVLAGVLVEEVVVPIPSPMILMGAGFLLVPASSTIPEGLKIISMTITVPAAFGSMVGSFFVYSFAYYGGKPLILRMEKYLDISWDALQRMEDRLTRTKRTGWLIVLLRTIPVIPVSLVSAACGVLRIPARTFAFFTFLGAVPRCFMLGFLGWKVGSAYRRVAEGLNSAEDVVAVLIALSLLGVLAFLYSRRKKHL